MSDCEYRAARDGEFEQLRVLWKEGFGDSDEFIDEYQRLIYQPQNAEVAFCDGKIVSMIMVVPTTFHRAGKEPLPAGYAYALTTAQGYRRRGIGVAVYRSLTDRKMADGMVCIASSPGDESLLHFYLRHSWKIAFYVRELAIAANELPQAIQADWTTPEKYNILREASLQGTDHYAFELPVVQMQEYVCRDSGGGLLYFPGHEPCCAVAEYEGDGHVLISELLAPDEQLLACAAGVLQHLPAEKVSIRLPVWSGESIGAKAVPYAILSPHGEMYHYMMKNPTAYLGLDLC
ncbi:MAG TPA: GNAT family N-acetyltransferase [Candidatus Ventrousia excrementavium]|uniref:GNAT family N-acetyltransferase n=1 Tax=Candidatus Ventrousia excrementavium TaxID=2840961 RepID=A0A9D1LL53_9CLOT|nr:GNAT family N-acetyltransferase [Candidatus Ventrousia excrementavium]